MNFRVAKRKQWILIDNLLLPVRPLVLTSPQPTRNPATKPAAKSAAKPPAKRAKSPSAK